MRNGEQLGAERSFMGQHKAKVWTYLIFGVLLLLGVLVVNFAVNNPELARSGLDYALGLPSWVFPIIGTVLGALIFWLGLKVETDWPEALGAFLISASVASAEILIGWDHFIIGGLKVMPYVIPLLAFFALLMVGMVKSR